MKLSHMLIGACILGVTLSFWVHLSTLWFLIIMAAVLCVAIVMEFWESTNRELYVVETAPIMTDEERAAGYSYSGDGPIVGGVQTVVDFRGRIIDPRSLRECGCYRSTKCTQPCKRGR